MHGIFESFRPMKEHLELRGCVPFAEKYERFFAAQKDSIDILPEGVACERRLMDILRFMQQLYGPSHGGYTSPEVPSNGNVQVDHSNSHNDDSTVLPEDDPSDCAEQPDEVEQPAMEVFRAPATIANFDDDELDDEVITFQPAFAKRAPDSMVTPIQAAPSKTIAESLVQGEAIAEQSAAMLLDTEEPVVSPPPPAAAIMFSPLPSQAAGHTSWLGWLPKSATSEMAGHHSAGPASPFGVDHRPSWSLGTSLGLPDTSEQYGSNDHYPLQQSAFGLGLPSSGLHHEQPGQPPQWHSRRQHDPPPMASPPPGFESEGNGYVGQTTHTSNPFFTG